ncbi:MAG: hypothetical protein NTV21_04380 [Planctomycetota bacterium]|nr:hypothetical protein [Planctomycetota bacterium]
MNERPQPGGSSPATPADAVLQGEIEVVTFHNPQTLYTVLRIAPEEGYDDPQASTLWRSTRVTAVGELDQPSPGQRLKLSRDARAPHRRQARPQRDRRHLPRA